MRPLFFLAVFAILPAAASAGEINHRARVGEALRQGCTVQQVHTPAGKTVHNAPIIRCSKVREAAAAPKPARAG